MPHARLMVMWASQFTKTVTFLTDHTFSVCKNPSFGKGVWKPGYVASVLLFSNSLFLPSIPRLAVGLPFAVELMNFHPRFHFSSSWSSSSFGCEIKRFYALVRNNEWSQKTRRLVPRHRHWFVPLNHNPVVCNLTRGSGMVAAYSHRIQESHHLSFCSFPTLWPVSPYY